MEAKVLLVDSHHGVYVPQVFAQQYALLDWGITAEQVGTLLLGPDDNEPYWECWDEVLQNAEIKLEGNVYTLTQDGDLWSICPELMSNEEYAAEFNGEMKPAPADSYEYEVCAECLQALANDSWDNTSPLEEQLIRNGLQKLHEEHERVVPDGAEYGFSWHNCECCGALAGERYRVIGFDMKKEGRGGSVKPRLKEPWATEYKETKELLWPKVKARKGWLEPKNFGTMRDTFEDLLQNAGVSTYRDGRSAFLGAYNSLYCFEAAKVVCSEFNVKELEKLRDYYRGTGYLSPIFNLVASSCEAAIKEKS